MAEQTELENDLWNQLYLRLEFERPVSLKESIQDSEAANTGQLNMQPKDMAAGMGRQ
jgi:hypothetical protein